MDSSRVTDVKPRVDDTEKIKAWKMADIVDSSQLKMLRLPDSLSNGKV